MMIVDAHLDLSYNAVLRGRDVTRPAVEQPIADNEIATVGLPDIRKGDIALICATIFCSPKRYATADEAHDLAIAQYEWYRRQWDSGELGLVKSAGDLPDSSRAQIPMILLMEGGDAFRNVDDVAAWFERGLRILGLAWRKTRMAGGTGFPGPLTGEGRAVGRAADKLGIIHDISHLADDSFWQLLEITTGAVMASHSNCRAIVPTDRQISDEMIKVLAARGAVIGINFYDQFLMPPDQYRRRRCTLDDVVSHIKHMADLLGTTKQIGLGTDMDGGLGRDDIAEEITTIADLPRVADALAAVNFSDDDVNGIMGQNWLSFFHRSLA